MTKYSLKDGKIVGKRQLDVPCPSPEESGEINLGFFGKIKEFFLCYLERRKWAKFKKTGLQKLPPPVFEYQNEIGFAMYPFETNTFDSDGCLAKMHRYKSGVLVDQFIRDNILSILKEERLKSFFDKDGYYFKSVTN
jgi:hypothetical protein